jgi:hypothetical protein
VQEFVDAFVPVVGLPAWHYSGCYVVKINKSFDIQVYLNLTVIKMESF